MRVFHTKLLNSCLFQRDEQIKWNKLKILRRVSRQFFHYIWKRKKTVDVMENQYKFLNHLCVVWLIEIRKIILKSSAIQIHYLWAHSYEMYVPCKKNVNFIILHICSSYQITKIWKTRWLVYIHLGTKCVSIILKYLLMMDAEMP